MYPRITYENIPDMSVAMSKKNADYRIRMARAQISTADRDTIQEMASTGIDLEKAYAGEIRTQEDIDTFLTDENNNSRNRVMWNANLLKPIVEQYRGAALQAEYNASVQLISHRAVTRRQVARAEAMLMQLAAERSEDMRRIVGAMNPVGDTMAEAMSIFEAAWNDPYQKAMQHLVEKAAEIAGVFKYDNESAWNFIFYGMMVDMLRPGGTFIHREVIDPKDFIWDTSAKMLDLSDASFMGTCKKTTLPKIGELWGTRKDDLDAIVATIRNDGWGRGNMKVDVISHYWIDRDIKEVGFVDEGGVPTMVVFGKDKKVSYNDLIDPPEALRDEFGGKRTKRSEVEVVMYSDFIPYESLAALSKGRLGDRIPDIELSGGVYDLQPYNPYDALRVSLPFAARVYALADGKVVSPVQAIKDPNRFVARVLGAMEAQMNVSGGRTVGVDMDMVDPRMTETDIDIAIKQGKPIGFHNGGRGISNAIHVFDSGAGSGTYAMLQIVQAVQEMVRTITGVHGPMMGEGQRDMLNGVTEMLIRRGVTMQEAFHGPMAQQKEQMFRMLATSGKEYYLSRPDVLMDMVTEEDLIPLYFTADMAMERCNGTVRRENTERDRRALANQWLDQLIQLGLIDRTRYADLYNRAYPEDVSVALRQYDAELRQAEKAQQREQAKQKMMGALAQEKMMLQQRQDKLDADRQKSADMLAKEDAKARTSLAREQLKAANKADQTMLEADIERSLAMEGAGNSV